MFGVSGMAARVEEKERAGEMDLLMMDDLEMVARAKRQVKFKVAELKTVIWSEPNGQD